MAALPPGSSFDRALNLINQAVGMLREGSSSSDVQNLPAASTSSSSGSLPVANASNGQNGAPPGTPTELSRLFPGFMRPSPAGSTQWSRNPWKPKQRGTPYQRFKPKDSWTHVFVCLSERDDSDVPQRDEKRALKEAGLGEKKIIFNNKNGQFEHVKSTLEDHFPKVKDVQGAFEILRASGARRRLEVIAMPPLGYTVPYLREALGQAIAYLRPVQRCLDMTPITQPSPPLDMSGAPSVRCVNCGKHVAISQLRIHEDGCSGGPSTASPTPLALEKESSNVAKLKELFPGEQFSVLQATLSTFAGDINKAAAHLAGCGEDDDNVGDLPPVLESRDDEGIELTSLNYKFDESSANDVKRIYKEKKQQGTEFIEVNRMQLSLLRQIMRIYKSPRFQLAKSLDVNFYHEQCADMGGPTKEFFHDAIASFTHVDPAFNIQLFGGQKGHLIPFYGVDAISSGCFEIAGKVVAHSILHDGPGFVGLAPSLVEYLATGSVDAARGIVSLNDIADLDLKQLIEEEILHKEVKDMSAIAKDRVEEVMVRHGLTDVPITDLNKEKAVNDLMVAEVLITRTLALDTFFRGLNCLGLGDLLRKYPIIKDIVFPSPDKVEIDPETLKNESAGRPLITSLVLFITGSTIIDPQESFEVVFQTNTKKKLLEADTCFNRVLIPTSHKSYEEFADACKLSVMAGATGYGRF
ncbi:uncharacterized protein [Acropora muricata]|uniref:uncharacterized protein isoform X2 n=1 Tax=Acropora muricata TaxID=159855 RepID=UPI0034E3D092